MTEPEIHEIEVFEGVYDANESLADENRRLFDEKRVFVINLMASPGAGKTSLVTRTVEAMSNGLRVAVIEGDIASSVDAEKLRVLGIPVIQINTGGACHLDAGMIRRALEYLDLDALDLLIVENVGNLVCPAEFRLGEHLKVMMLSVAEGHDKPLKYPLMFGLADVLVVNKVDMLELTDFDLGLLRETVTKMNAAVRIFEVSCRTGQGLAEYTGWLSDRIGSFISS
ncbi:MAG: hydrogenase nickel incorporation protein HypB [Candidatus Geothermincolia bacterium]